MGYTFISIMCADEVVLNTVSGDLTIRQHGQENTGKEIQVSVAIDINGPQGLLLLYQFRDAVEKAFKRRMDGN